MGYQPYLIAPFGTGLDTDLEPWILPPDAFSEIENGHIHHGVIEKREGYRTYGKLVHGDNANYGISGITQANPGVVTVVSTAGITNGDTVILRSVVGMTEVNGNEYTVANVGATTFELSGVDTSGFTAYGGGGVVYIIPGLRVMGLHRHIDPQNAKELLAFDTRRASIFDSTNEYFVPLDAADIFDGDETNYIWADNWASTSSSTAVTLYRLYFTNGKAFDGTNNGIRYYTGPSGTTTTSFAPLINGLTRINGCKLLFAFRQRLLLLHTFEGANTYPQRLRWCQIQNPDAAGAWDDNVAGKGGFVDAPTGEQIISARHLQNGIVVFFTSSVWTISPTSDPALPFRFDKINDFRACDSQMSAVEYDRYVVALGVRGITATDGVETKRIDNRIEDFVTDDIDIDNFGKVFSARSYENTRTWMLYPKIDSDDTNAALILDDDSSAYSKYDIDMNVLGYSNNVSNDLAAEDFTAENDLDVAANDLADETALSWFWSGNAETFIGGDKAGVVYVMETGTSDDGDDITFTLASAAWNPFKEIGVEAQMGYIDFYIDSDELTNMTVEFFKDSDDSPYKQQIIDCLPNLNYINKVTNAVIKAPATSGVRVSAPKHGLATGNQVYIYGVKGMVSINDNLWTVTVINENTFDIAVDATNFNAYTGAGQLVERRFYKTKTWKRVYAGGIGYQHKIRITSSGTQTPLRIHAFKPYFRQRGKRTI